MSIEKNCVYGDDNRDDDDDDDDDDDNDQWVRTLAGSVADLGGGREERVQRAITYPGISPEISRK